MQRSRRVERFAGASRSGVSLSLAALLIASCASGGDGTGRDTGGGGGIDAFAAGDVGALDAAGGEDDAAIDPEDDAAIDPEDDAAIAMLDAPMMSPDAFVMPGTDAFVVPPDAFVVLTPDAFTPPPDAYVPPMADAFVVLTPDAFVPSDAYVTPPDAFVPPDAYRVPDAYVVPDARVVCTLPTNACADGAESRNGCGGARVIGRRSAGMAAGYSVMGNTCDGSDHFDDCDWDAGEDQTYRIWLRAGERVSARITARSAGCHATSPAITLKLYESTGCTDVTCGSDRWCHEFVDNGDTFSQTAVRDGWIVIVVDSSTAFEDEGRYTLNVTLTSCATAGCEC